MVLKKVYDHNQPLPTRVTTTITSIASFLATCRSLYLHYRWGLTVSACRTPRTCSLADDCRKYTWCRPTMARPVHCRSPLSAVPIATLGVDSVKVAVADSTVLSVMADQYKCSDKTPRWFRPVVLKIQLFELFTNCL